MKTYYMAHAMKTKLESEGGGEVKLPDEWAGVMPIYRTEEECRADYPESKITELVLLQ